MNNFIYLCINKTINIMNVIDRYNKLIKEDYCFIGYTPTIGNYLCTIINGVCLFNGRSDVTIDDYIINDFIKSINKVPIKELYTDTPLNKFKFEIIPNEYHDPFSLHYQTFMFKSKVYIDNEYICTIQVLDNNIIFNDIIYPITNLKLK